MPERTTYQATATPEGKWWAIRIDGLPDGLIGVTQALVKDGWSEVEEMTREVIALLLDVAEDSFDIEITKETE